MKKMEIEKIKLCGFCDTPKGKRYLCSGCRGISYCSTLCQKKHWPTHKIYCSNDGMSTTKLRKRFVEWYQNMKLDPLSIPWKGISQGKFIHLQIDDLDKFLDQDIHKWSSYNIKDLYYLFSVIDDKNQSVFKSVIKTYEANKDIVIPVFINLRTNTNRSIYLLFLEEIIQ